MNYINHITLNTGHVRKTYPDEVDKELYFILSRLIRDSLRHGGTDLFEGYRLKSTRIESFTIATIFGSDVAPILTTACSKSGDDELWRLLHTTSTVPLATRINDDVPTPYIADRIEVGASLHKDALQWTGDFSRCFGWIVLAPEKIR